MTAAMFYLCGAWGRVVNKNVRASGFHLQMLDQHVLDPILTVNGGALKKGRFVMPNFPLTCVPVERFRSKIDGILREAGYGTGSYVVRSRLMLPRRGKAQHCALRVHGRVPEWGTL